MEIRPNTSGIQANRSARQNDPNIKNNLDKLSSGYKPNGSADNAAARAIAEKMSKQSAGISGAIEDTQNGINMIQASEGALHEIRGILSRMRTLAEQCANVSDKSAIELEFVQLFSEIDKIADTNADFTAAALGLTSENLNLSSQETANKAVDTINIAENKASLISEKLGEAQNRLEHQINNLTATNENLNQVESRIRDTDMAKEKMNQDKTSVLKQASQSMLDQQNKLPDNVLKLLQ
jgi:flagellin